jgi:quercetin dioxygenase-like cupin family protein
MFFRKSDLKARPVLQGITLRAIAGDKTMMTFFDLEPHACIPPHRHPHEQISY